MTRRPALFTLPTDLFYGIDLLDAHCIGLCHSFTPQRFSFRVSYCLVMVARVATMKACHVLVENPENRNPPRLVGLKDPAIHIL